MTKWTRPQKLFVSIYVLAWLIFTACNVARADDTPPPPIPIHVFLVWTDEKSGSIAYSEHIRTMTSADHCGQLTLKEAEPHVKDFAENSKKWTPHIVCGIAAEHYAGKQEAEPEDEPEQDDSPEKSHPGTGGDAPSLPL